MALGSHAQVKIKLAGIHCYAETTNGSGSDELYFVINVFKKGVRIATRQIPEWSYKGGVDAGGTYFKNYEPVLYEGPAQDIAIEVIPYEWDSDDIAKRVATYKNKISVAVQDGTFDAKWNNLGFERGQVKTTQSMFAEQPEAGADDIGTAFTMLFSKEYLDKTNALEAKYVTIDNDLDRVAYQKKVDFNFWNPDAVLTTLQSAKSPNKDNYYFDKNGFDGNYGFFISTEPVFAQLSDKAIRQKWNQLLLNGFNTGALVDFKTAAELTNGVCNVARFENCAIYATFVSNAFEVHGDIYKAYNAAGEYKNQVLGLPVSDETDIINTLIKPTTESKWAQAGYKKYNQFTNGYILWKPGQAKILSKAEFEAGPIQVSTLTAQLATLPMRPTATNIVGNADLIKKLIFDKGKEANLGAVHTESAMPRPTAGAGGYFLRFEKGWVYYNPHTAAAYAIGGDIMKKWGDTGYETGPLGFPTSDETDDHNYTEYSRASHFDKGIIYYSAQKGTMVTTGNNTKAEK
ncbi:LGFP repeat-containing protein [Mucilaginibacter psychrotolerans]|nr:hypothetical protein [Mucilaginibacter psychrotolerans]